MTTDDLMEVGMRRQEFSGQDLQAENEALRQELEYYQGEVDYYQKAIAADPWKSNPTQNSDERFADRMLKQRIPDDQIPHGKTLWVTRSDIIELLALIPSLSRKDYRRFVRDWEDIETLSQGGGNQQIVQSRQERLVFEIQLARSVGDAPITGMTERSALMTKRQEIDQKLNTGSQQRRPSGWVDTIMSKFGGR